MQHVSSDQTLSLFPGTFKRVDSRPDGETPCCEFIAAICPSGHGIFTSPYKKSDLPDAVVRKCFRCNDWFIFREAARFAETVRRVQALRR